MYALNLSSSGPSHVSSLYTINGQNRLWCNKFALWCNIHFCHTYWSLWCNKFALWCNIHFSHTYWSCLWHHTYTCWFSFQIWEDKSHILSIDEWRIIFSFLTVPEQIRLERGLCVCASVIRCMFCEQMNCCSLQVQKHFQIIPAITWWF